MDTPETTSSTQLPSPPAGMRIEDHEGLHLPGQYRWCPHCREVSIRLRAPHVLES